MTTTGPTPISAGTAGTPVSQQAISSRHQSLNKTDNNQDQDNSISDTLETSDREADGREPLTPGTTKHQGQQDNGSILDVSG